MLRRLVAVLSLIAFAVLIASPPTSAQDDIYLPPDDELVIDDGDEFEGISPDGGIFGDRSWYEPYPPDPECVAFFTGRDDGTIPQPFARLPNICQWRYAGFPCEPENDPPEGWLAPGGYCDTIRNPQSISPPGTSDTPVKYPVPKVGS